jgi:hypothetical protein
MPRYVIERQFLVPMFEHIFVEAPNLHVARPWTISHSPGETMPSSALTAQVQQL